MAPRINRAAVAQMTDREFKQFMADLETAALATRGRLGGLARAEALTQAQRTIIAHKAGKAGGWPKGRKRGPSPLKGRKKVTR